MLCALAIWATQVEARNLYVALNGSNSNPGTITQPWRTISYAVGSSSGVHAGDTIIVRQGNYPESVFPQVSGTATQSIILRRLKGETVTLDPGKIRFDSGINHWKVWGLDIKRSSGSGLEVTGTHAENSLYFQNLSLTHNRQDGVYLSGAFGSVTILNCLIQYNGEVNGVPQQDEGHGIVIYGGGPGKLYVKRNLIANNWHKGLAFGSAVQYSGSGSQVDSNLIINNYESGVDFSPDNSFFRCNFVSRNGLRDTESGEFGDKGMMTTPYCSGTTVAFNIFKSNGGNELSPSGSANFFYNNTLYKDVYYNAVSGSPYQAVITFYDSSSPNSVFRNNIFCNMLSQENHHWAIISEVYNSYTNQIWSNNLYWCPNSSQQAPNNKPFKLYGAPGPGGSLKTLAEVQATWPSEENNSVYVNPGFVSGPDSNFTLLPNSPAIDAGTNVGYPYQGQAPDIGRFEFGAATISNTPPDLFEGTGAVLSLEGIGAGEFDVTVDPYTNEMSTDYHNGAVAGSALPGMVTLEQASPNPFNPTTSIRYHLPNAAFVKLSVYTISGQLVKTLVEGQREAGTHEAIFDGAGLASGVFLYRLDAGAFSQTQRMMLTK
jgi:hypothetical protein